MTDVARFWQSVEKTPTCWLWRGRLDRQGYGRRGLKLAHRISWILLRGAIPKGLTIDHLCRVRNCVNPEHLEVVTMHENWRRGLSSSAISARLTHCRKGHPFDGVNTRIEHRTRGEARACRACNREAVRRYREHIPRSQRP